MLFFPVKIFCVQYWSLLIKPVSITVGYVPYVLVIEITNVAFVAI
jgi:hypothetical protein